MKKTLLLLAFGLFHFLGFSQGTIVSISPNASQQGQTLTTTITGNGTMFLNSSPQGNIQNVYMQLAGTNTIYGDWFNLTVTDDTHFDIGWTIPGGAPVGVYDLYVVVVDALQPWMTYTLPLYASFTIGTPDGYIQGRVFNDSNQNGIQDGGELGLSGYGVSFSPTGYSQNTDVNGDYSFPAANGTYTVSYNGYYYNQMVPVPGFPSSLSATINNANSAGNNFPVTTGLTSFYPDSAYQGQNITVTVFAKGIFAAGGGANGNITSARFTNGATTITVSTNNITFINSNTATVKFSVPAGANLGLYDFRITTNTGTFYGYHFLNGIFEVVPAPLYMNGIVFFDADSDGVKAPTESGIPNEKVFLSPDSTFAFTDNNGNYSVGTVPGTHTLTWVQQNPFVHLSPGSPASYTATVSTTTNGYDFGLVTNNPAYSSQVTLAPCWAGCVHPNWLRFTITNTSALSYSGYAYFVKDSGMTLNTGGGTWAGAQPDSVSGDTLFFNFSNLAPLATLTINPSFITPNGGDTIYFSVTVVSLDGSGNAVYFSTDSGSHVVNCSMDPNEKFVRPAGVYAQHYTLLSDTLEYTVLFQNTGTDTAYTVVIRDTIDNNFDLSSLQIVNVSHAMTAEIPLLSRVIKFSFANILLPDSNTNEARSHGYVVYRIRPMAGTPSNTLVYNKADIYFDFNLPVATNETFNTLVTTIPVGLASLDADKNNVTVIPNPFNEEATFIFDNPEGKEYKLEMFNVAGERIFSKNLSSNKFNFNRGNWSSGLYLYQLTPLDGNEILHGKFIIE